MHRWVTTALAVGLLFAQGAGAAPPPFSEAFTGLDLPTNAILTCTSSSSNGRVRVVADLSTASCVTNPVPAFDPGYSSWPKANVQRGTNAFIGNLFYCTNDVFLSRHEPRFTITNKNAVTVWLSVYESTTSNGVFTMISSNGVSTSQYSDFDGVECSVPLRQGRYYLIGWGFRGGYDCLVSNNVASAATGYGTALGGYVLSGAPASGAFTNVSFTSTMHCQKLRFTREGVVRMDSTALGGDNVTNAVVLQLDLANKGPLLSYRVLSREFPVSGARGLFLSTNGTTFTKITTWPWGGGGLDLVWSSLTTNLADAAAGVGMTLSNPTWIKFQQCANTPWEYDGAMAGVQIDDLSLVTLPDYRMISVSDTGPVLVRGTNAPIVIPYGCTVDASPGAGMPPITGRAVTNRFEWVNGGQPLYDSSLVWTSTIPSDHSVSVSLTGSLTIPAGQRLTNGIYDCRGTVDAPNAIQEAYEDNNAFTYTREINHYSGRLRFGDADVALTVTNYYPGFGFFWSHTYHIIDGYLTVAGRSTEIDELFVIKDRQTLDYRLNPDYPTNLEIVVTNEMLVAGVRYRYHGSTIRASMDGAFADIAVRLPAGLGYATNSGAMFLSDRLVFTGVSLGADLALPVSLTNDATLYYCDEGAPLSYAVTRTVWHTASGRFDLTTLPGTNGVTYVRRAELSYLQSVSADLLTPLLARKPSNEAYFDAVDHVVGDSLTVTASKGAALVSASVELHAGVHAPHFPYSQYAMAVYGWTGPGLIVFTNGAIAGGGASYLDGVAAGAIYPTTVFAGIPVAYQRTCLDEDCGEGDSQTALAIRPDGDRLWVLPDGGLACGGTIIGGGQLTWGARADSLFTHITDTFSAGRYYMPGYTIPPGWAVRPRAVGYGPAEILLSGADTNGLTAGERNGSSAYFQGLADYAGINLRVGTNFARRARSVLGNSQTDWYPLRGRSKYYLRISGVSGVHAAAVAPGNAILVEGYQTVFTNLLLGFLSGVNTLSATDGQMWLPRPSEVDLPFRNLRFSCLGHPTELDLADPSRALQLAYWQATIRPQYARFEADAGGDCDTRRRYLTMGVRSRCALVDADMHGTFAFKPDGNLVVPADEFRDITSRLSLPSTVRFRGPTNELYSLVPATEAYLNNFDSERDQDNGLGRINFAGALDIPFFDDMPVHVQSGASTNLLAARVNLTGGWTQNGGTFFNRTGFDPRNDGYPTNAMADNAAYLAGPDYRPHARKTWLGVIDFDYPLAWTPVTRSFKSAEPYSADFLVLKANHQVDYLSARYAELSFGAELAVMPRGTLGNIAYNIVDEATGVASSLTKAAGDEVRLTLLNGLGDMDKLLRDKQDEWLGELVDKGINPVVDALYDRLHTAAVNAPDADYYSAIIDDTVAGVNGGTENVASKLSALSNTGSELFVRVDRGLSRIDAVLAAFTDQVTIDPVTEEVLLDPKPGLLSFSGTDNPVLNAFATSMLNDLCQAVAQQLGEAVNEKLRPILADAQPTLLQIITAMNELRGIIADAHERLQAVGDFRAELAAAVDPAVVNALTQRAAEAIKAELAAMQSRKDAFTDFTPDEIKAMIRQRIADELYGSEMPANLSRVLRARIYELDAAIREAADSVFAQVNDVLRQLLSACLAELEDKVRGMISPLDEYMGNAKISGYAHINGDALKELRLDGALKWKVPGDLDFKGYLILRQLDSDGASGCTPGGGKANEVIGGADDVSIKWISDGLRASVYTKFTFEPAPTYALVGMAGGFELTGGAIGFESFAVNELAAAVAFGASENYLSTAIHCQFGNAEVGGGIYFGRACDLLPISMWDPDAKTVLGDPPFTGVYAYGEGWVPIYDYGCPFNIVGGAGAGIYAFVDGPIGGKIMIGAKGEAICAVTVRGSVTLAGSKNGSDLAMTGRGRISGKAGCCPFCVKFGKTVKVIYRNGTWDAKY